MLYSGTRFALYEWVKASSTSPTHAPSAPSLALMAAMSGSTGSVVSNFADVVCLRMQNDPALPPALRRNYRNIGQGAILMIRTEGWSSIWTGVWIGAARAGVATATQLAGYDVLKREILHRTAMGDTVPTHITASCLAGFTSTLICNPLDVLKARIMTRKTNRESLWAVLESMFKREGLRSLFKGLTPALISRAPSTIITFVTFEQLKRAYRRINGLEE